MRKSVLIAIACAAIPAAAPAQGLDAIIGLVSNSTSSASGYQYNGCSYQRGVFAALCSVNRATSAYRDAASVRRRYDEARRADATSIDLSDKRPDLTAQLSALCSRGDEVACDTVRRWRTRGQPVRPQSREFSLATRDDRATEPTAIPEAVVRLCANGDQVACDTVRRRSGR